MTEPGLDPAPCRICGADKEDHSDDDGRDHEYEEEDFVESIDRLEKANYALAIARIRALAERDKYRVALHQASLDRDEARRVARTLAEMVHILPRYYVPTVGQVAAIQAALAYPDTTKEPET